METTSYYISSVQWARIFIFCFQCRWRSQLWKHLPLNFLTENLWFGKRQHVLTIYLSSKKSVSKEVKKIALNFECYRFMANILKTVNSHSLLYIGNTRFSTLQSVVFTGLLHICWYWLNASEVVCQIKNYQGSLNRLWSSRLVWKILVATFMLSLWPR